MSYWNSVELGPTEDTRPEWTWICFSFGEKNKQVFPLHRILLQQRRRSKQLSLPEPLKTHSHLAHLTQRLSPSSYNPHSSPAKLQNVQPHCAAPCHSFAACNITIRCQLFQARAVFLLLSVQYLLQHFSWFMINWEDYICITRMQMVR